MSIRLSRKRFSWAPSSTALQGDMHKWHCSDANNDATCDFSPSNTVSFRKKEVFLILLCVKSQEGAFQVPRL